VNVSDERLEMFRSWTRKAREGGHGEHAVLIPSADVPEGETGRGTLARAFVEQQQHIDHLIRLLEGRDRILTDMLQDGEASAEMWRQGAEAMRGVIIAALPDIPLFAEVGSVSNCILAVLVPQPPSQSASGEALKPSRVLAERDRYRAALEAMNEVFNLPHQGADARNALLYGILREALKE
jgi:hypothetical protein